MTSQFDPEDWYKSLHDAVIAESIVNRIVSNAEIVQLDGPNMRRYTSTATTEAGESWKRGREHRYPDPPALPDQPTRATENLGLTAIGRQ